MTSMSYVRSGLWVLMGTLLLSGCGLLRPFIGSRSASLEIAGDSPTLVVAQASESGFAAIAASDISSTFVESIPQPIGESVFVETENRDRAPRGLKPVRFQETVGFAPDATVALNPDAVTAGLTTDALPEQLILTDVTLVIATFDGAYDGLASLPPITAPESFFLLSSYSSDFETPLTLEKGTCEDATCTYSFSDPEAAARAVEVRVDNTEREVEVEGETLVIEPFNSLYEIRTGGDETNTSNVNVVISGAGLGEALVGAAVTFEFVTSDGKTVL